MDMELLITIGTIAIALITIVIWRFDYRYGKIRPSNKVTQAYECFSVAPDINYYISGPDNYPNAIMGIESTWILESDLWKKRDLVYHSMKELVQGMQNKSDEHYATLHSFDIIDNRGRTIGNLFTILGIVMPVEITGERKVVVHTPPIDTYR